MMMANGWDWAGGTLWGGMWIMMFGFFFWILLLAGLAYFIYYLVVKASENKQVGQQRFSTSDTDTALEILRKRYAKGEISDEEYERMKDKLST